MSDITKVFPSWTYFWPEGQSFPRVNDRARETRVSDRIPQVRDERILHAGGGLVHYRPQRMAASCRVSMVFPSPQLHPGIVTLYLTLSHCTSCCHAVPHVILYLMLSCCTSHCHTTSQIRLLVEYGARCLMHSST